MNTEQFLFEHGLHPDLIDVDSQSDLMVKNMISGLEGKRIDMPMIPTYLGATKPIADESSAIVIDAGGTNFRAGLATYGKGGIVITDVFKSKMPGTESPVTWDYFISFIADNISHVIDKSDLIGFCFSYSATITPEIDGIVQGIDKEVKIENCEGKLIGKSLTDELAKRGKSGKKCVVINDTVAALLGNAASQQKDKYSGFMGMICGTGINTCAYYNDMLINLESGFYTGMPRGDFDIQLDMQSAQPGEKLMEKMCSGAYIGQLAKLALNLEGNSDGATVDFLSREGNSFEKEVCLAIIKRSAKCMASNILALMKLTKSGLDKPYCICAEGSLIEKNQTFLPYLRQTLQEYSDKYKCEIVIGHETTLPGSAVAALNNN